MAHQAPGKHFRKGITFPELLEMFPDDATAEAWFVQSRWPEGVTCPHCGSSNVQIGAKPPSLCLIAAVKGGYDWGLRVWGAREVSEPDLSCGHKISSRYALGWPSETM